MTVRCARLKIASLPACFFELVRCMFFSEQQERFFQCSVMTDCVSLIASADDLALLPSEHLELDDSEWCVVQVSEGQYGFDAVGVAERITGPLAAAAVPVLYVTTFSQDYVLVPPDRLAEA